MSMQLAEIAYTSEALISDCVGRYITNASGVQLVNLISSRTYLSVWQAFVYWVASQYQAEGSANLSPIGVLTFTKPPFPGKASKNVNGVIVSTPPNTKAIPKFSFFRTFLDLYGIAMLPGQPHVDVMYTQDAAAQRMNLLSLSKLAGCESQTFRIAMSHLTRRIGEVIGAGEPVFMDFGIGALKGDKNSVTFEFYENFEAPTDSALPQAPPRPSHLTSNTASNLHSQYTSGPASPMRKPSPSKTRAPTVPPLPLPITPFTDAPQPQPALPTASTTYRRKLPAPAPLATARALAVTHAPQSALTHTASAQGLPSLPSPTIAVSASPASAPAPFSLTRVLERIQAVCEAPTHATESASRRAPPASLPPVLDLFARTRAAVFSDSTGYCPPTSRIAANYAPQLAPLTLVGAGIVRIPGDERKESRRAPPSDEEVVLSRLWARLALPTTVPPPGTALRTPAAQLRYAHALKCALGNSVDVAHFHQLTQLPLHSLSPYLALLADPALAPLHRQQLHASLTRSVARYTAYVTQGVPTAAVCPLNPAWLRAALSLLSARVASAKLAPLDPAVTTTLLGALVEEVTRDYIVAMKRAIVDYVLLAPQHRTRLGVPLPPPPASHAALWGCSVSPLAAPLSWRPRIQHAYLALATSLYSVGALPIALLRVSAKYRDLLLFDVPAARDLPISLAELEARQRKHMSRVHKVLATQWLEDCEHVVRAHVTREGLTDGSASALFESVATLMAAQLRTIVHRSISAFHAFVAQYALAPLIQCPGTRAITAIEHADGIPAQLPALPAGITDMVALQRHGLAYTAAREELVRRGECSMPAPALLQRLEVRRARDRSMVALDTAHVDMHKAMLALVDRMCESVRGMARVETKVFPLLRHNHGRGGDIPVWVEGELGTSAMVAMRQAVSQVVERSTRECHVLSQLYEPYERVLDGEAELEHWLAAPRDVDDWRERILHYRATAASVSRAPRRVRCGLVLVDCSQANLIIAQKARMLATKVCDHVAARILAECARLADDFKMARGILLRKPSAAKDLHALLGSLQQFVHTQQARLVQQCHAQRRLLMFLLESELGYRLGSDVLRSVGEVWGWVKQMRALVHECELVCENERVRLERVLRERRVSVMRAVEQIRAQCLQLRDMCEPKRATEYLGKVATVQQSIERARVEGEAIQEQERLLNLQVSEFTHLDECAHMAAPFQELWALYVRWQAQEQEWLHGHVFDLDGAPLENQVRHMYDSACNIVALLAHTRTDTPAPATRTDRTERVDRTRREASVYGVAEALRDDIAAFQPHVVLARVLCEPAMKERHWDRVCALVGSQVRPDGEGRAEHITLHKLAEMGVGAHLRELGDISEAARKEGAVLSLVEGMKSEWQELSVRVKPHKDTGCVVLDGDSVEEAEQLLEEQSVKLGRVKGSVFARAHASAVQQWEQWLDGTREALRVWVQVQAAWAYMEPVYTAGEIAHTLHAEAMRFTHVDAQWRALMRDACVDLRVRALSALPHLSALLESLHADLSLLHKRLQQYLAVKRDALPRLYFLSDEHLLALLGHTSAEAAAPQLQQCFEGVHSLLVEDDVVRAIVSREGERLTLMVGVDVREARGQAERWLGELEARMRESVAEHINKAIRAFSQTQRSAWLFDWPAQVVLCVNHLLWTQAVGECLSAGAQLPQAMSALMQRLSNELAAVVAMVRQTQSPLHTVLLSALLVMDVHNRDITQHLIDTRTARLSAFEWASQLRYYWECGNVAVRMVTTSIPYGCEYIGNTSRLVVTSLTDRCYRSLMMAMEVHAGGAPQGPAGTGKTETVKDLSKACGMQCLVFNCSDALDYKQMGNFFKGVSGAGAWVCFDEFNRLQVEVLSVVAQQILSVQLAKEARAPTIWLEGSLVRLRESANVFITMNPGYAGRSELPDNLQALVRPVAMMVPDYTLIAQVTLFACGFQHATALAGKITKTYKLCSEQLSSQSHYDYGMRAVKAVLSAAHTLRQQHPHAQEADVVLTAVVQVNKPKFMLQDVPLFEGIVQDLFPGARPVLTQTQLRAQLQYAAQELQLEAEEWLLHKCTELWEMLCIRHGVMLVGEGASGKSAVWRTLHRALNRMAHKPPPGPHHHRHHHHHHHHHHTVVGEDVCACGVEAVVINPKALTTAQLYGGTSPLTQEWCDGILARKFRELCAAPAERRGWLVLDGPVDAQWIEDMNTVLDDNKKLCLMSGETMVMRDGMAILVEVGDLAVASPATVSRCGMVLLERNVDMARSVINTWIKTVPLGSDGLEVVESMLHHVLRPLLAMIRGERPGPNGEHVQCLLALAMSDVALIGNVLDVFDAVMEDEWAKVRDPAAALAREAERQRQREVEDTKALSQAQRQRRLSLAESTITIAAPSRRGSVLGLGAGGRSRGGSFSGAAAGAACAACGVLTVEQDPNLLAKLEGGLLLAMVWGVGGAVQGADRDKFEAALREAVLGLEHGLVGLCKGSVWAHTFDVERARWTPWLQMPGAEDAAGAKGLVGVSVIVPTVTSVAATWLTEKLLASRVRTMLVGGSGTGKSLFAAHCVKAMQTHKDVRSVKVCVCGTTCSGDVQAVIENNVERRRKGEYAGAGGRDLLLFLDDVHMAERDVYGVQSACELVRFFSEQRGLWDTKEHVMKRVTGVRLMCSVGALGGGRTMSDRFARQWVPLALPAVDDGTLGVVLTALVAPAWGGAAESVRNMVTPIVNATKYLYTATTTKLLPTPSRAHYTFTSRDALKIVSGVCRVAHPDRDSAVRAWLHESARVVCDRLVCDSERALAVGWLEDAVEKKMGVDGHNILAHLAPAGEAELVVGRRKSSITIANLNNLYFGSYGAQGVYAELSDPAALESLWEAHQRSYNALSKTPLSLVMFQYACTHLSRICRAVTAPTTHMVLMGERGSGRQSLCRLACHAVGVEVTVIDGDQHYDADAWRKDLRACMLRCGIRKKHVCLLLSETDMRRAGVMSDVNTLMNGGQIDRLWAAEDVGEIVDAVGEDYKRATGVEDGGVEQVMEYFTARVRDCLHIVCCVSRDMTVMRERLRVYPALATSTVIDCYDAWPADALERIAAMHLTREHVPTLAHGAQALAKALVSIHLKVAEHHGQQLRAAVPDAAARKIVISGGMFLEALRNTCTFLHGRVAWVREEEERYFAGVSVIDRSAVSIAALQRELEDMQPALRETTRETSAMLATVEQETTVALSMRERVRGEEHVAMDAAARARQMEAECETDLATVLPILDKAVSALDRLTLQDIAEVKVMRNPVKGVRVVMECLCHMKQIPPARIPDPSGSGKMITDYWEVSKKRILSDPKLLQSLKQFDKESIQPKVLKKMREYIALEDFNLDKLRNISQAVGSVAAWIHAVERYNTIWKEVEPKRDKLAEVRAECAACESNVAQLRAELAKVEANVAQLTQTLRATEQKKAALEEKMQVCQVKCERAEALLSGLRGERERWHAKVQEYKGAQQWLVGRCVLAGALCTYAGWLDNAAREHLLAQWQLACEEQGVRCTQPGANASGVLQQLLCTEVTVSEWLECGLPNDHYSLDNAVMATKAHRWPLIVDPHKQATKWLTQLYRKHAHTQQHAAAAAASTDSLPDAPVEPSADDTRVDAAATPATAAAEAAKVGESVARDAAGAADTPEAPEASDAPDALEAENAPAESAAELPLPSEPVFVGDVRVDLGVCFVKYGAKDMHAVIEQCITSGAACVLEDVTELDPALAPLIHKSLGSSGAMTILRMGDKEIEYHPDFRLFLLCSSTADLAPELASACNTVLFELTARAAQEQLLSVVVGVEREKIEAERKRLLVVGVEIGKQLVKVEQDILRVLSSSSGNILDDSEAVNVVTTCKEVAQELKEKKQTIVKAEREMERSRDAYREVSVHACTLYMCVSGLAALEHMYQYGYEWFVGLLVRVLHDTRSQHRRRSHSASAEYMGAHDDEEEDDEDVVVDVRARVSVVKEALLRVVYSDVCAGLLTQHRDVFTVMLVVAMGLANKHILPAHWSFLTSQTATLARTHATHPAAAVVGPAWERVGALAALEGFEALPDAIAQSPAVWRALATTHLQDPLENAVDDRGNTQLTALCGLPPLPAPFDALCNEQHTAFMRAPYALAVSSAQCLSGAIGAACVLRCVRPDKLALFLLRVCELVLGPIAQARHAPFSLHASSTYAQPHVPLLMLLSGGSDPMHAFLAYAKQRGVTVQTQVSAHGADGHRASSRCVSISLGQGQGPIAAQAIAHACKVGGWVMLQNCHLALSWLPTLAAICADMATNAAHVHPDFRLFLTSYPTPQFPLSIARAAIKCVQQPPQGLRANLANTLQHHTIRLLLELTGNAHTLTFNASSDVGTPLAVVLRNIALSLAVLHCVLKERVEFGPLGMSVPYAFSQSDLDISIKHAINVLTHTQGSSALGLADLTMPLLQRRVTRADIDLCVNALRYLVGECNYGGRVTDEWDRRVLNTIIAQFLSAEVLTWCPAAGDAPITCGDTGLELFAGATEDLPAWVAQASSHTSPQAVGLHSNAVLSRENARSQAMLHALHCAMRQAGSSAGTATQQTPAARTHALLELCAHIASQLPSAPSVAAVMSSHAPSYSACLHTVLHHETERCASILQQVQADLVAAQACIKGEAVPTARLEALIEDLQGNRVPDSWVSLAGATMLPLHEWVAFLAQRTKHLKAWAAHGQLERAVVWFGGLFYPHGFITAVTQTYARRHGLAIDAVAVQYGYLHQHDSHRAHQHVNKCRGLEASLEAHGVPVAHAGAVAGMVNSDGTVSVEEGVVIYGMCIEGATWADDARMLVDMKGGLTQTAAPAIWLRPVTKAAAAASPCFSVDANQHQHILAAQDTGRSDVSVYLCPMYRVGTRRGALLTTGHSTNFIHAMPMPAQGSASKWVKRGAAIVTEQNSHV